MWWCRRGDVWEDLLCSLYARYYITLHLIYVPLFKITNVKIKAVKLCSHSFVPCSKCKLLSYCSGTSSVLWRRENVSCQNTCSSAPPYSTYIAVNTWPLSSVGWVTVRTLDLNLRQHWPKLWMTFPHCSLPRLLLAMAMMYSILSGTTSTK